MTASSSGPTRHRPSAAMPSRATASAAHPPAPTTRGRFVTHVAQTGPTTRGRPRVAASPGRTASVEMNREIGAMTIRVRDAADVDAVAAVGAAGARRMSSAERPPRPTRRHAGRPPAVKATTNRFRPPTACGPAHQRPPVAKVREPTAPPQRPRRVMTRPAARAAVGGGADGVAVRDDLAVTANRRHRRRHHRAAIRASHASEAGVDGGRLESLGRHPSREAAATTSRRSRVATTMTTRVSSSSASRRQARSRLAGNGLPRTKTSLLKAASTRCSTYRVGSKRSAS